MRFSEARHKQVVVTATATTAGRVDGFVVAPGPGRVTALRLGKTHGSGSLLSYADLKSFGMDAVTLDTPDGLRPPLDADEERAASKDLELIGKLALSERGDSLGTVVDVEFEASTGRIVAVLTDRVELHGEGLVGLGSYAAVFADEVPA